ncbi:MAG: dihydrolipoyllysine-residue succinyltransferase [Acidobacteria bacterium]|nr:MAG: dihydrolipoyllysine-residue succinyltransferase [Acidobacteriota bacterium]
MRVDIVMPQMGESIAEGTITKWMKSVGDTIERDEPIFEISTDKVDAEIPSPAAGTLVEIKNQEGETVPINEVVAVIETDAGAAASAPVPEAEKPAPEETEAAVTPPTAPQPAAGASRFVSPVVRRIADERGIDPSRVPGTGAGGRVTKKDILAFIASGAATAAPVSAAAPAAAATPGPAAVAPRVGPAPVTFGPGADTIREPLSVMRKKIAEHMIHSRRTSAHVQSLFEVDMTHCARLRAKHKQAYVDRHGVKLSYLAFVIKAVCDALRSWPILNSSLEGDDIVYKKHLNVGIAVALDWGLIVPVVHNADHLSVAGLSAKVHDLANRARGKQLNPDEVQGGTFTITNPGQFGGLFGLPIINQPQVAILGLGGIKKRPVVINDAIAIRSMMYLSMSYDHRVVDGAVADQFLAQIVQALENFDESLL